MKNNFLSSITICLLTSFMVSCDTNDMFDGSNDIVTITRDLSSFDRIIVNDDMDVTVIENNTQIVEIEVNNNLQDQLITRVRNNTLEISLQSGSYRNEFFQVNIQIPSLERIQLDDNTRADVEFDVDELDVQVNDSSALVLDGSANVLNVDNNDAGLINGFSFITDTVNADVDDAAELEITCNVELNGSVNSDGLIQYRGMPTINVVTSSNGKVVDAN